MSGACLIGMLCSLGPSFGEVKGFKQGLLCLGSVSYHKETGSLLLWTITLRKDAFYFYAAFVKLLKDVLLCLPKASGWANENLNGQ